MKIDPYLQRQKCRPMTLVSGNIRFMGILAGVPVGGGGLMEFAGVDKAARSKMGVWKMQEWTIRHHFAGVDNAGVDKSARCGKGVHCRSGQCGTMWWTMQEWSELK